MSLKSISLTYYNRFASVTSKINKTRKLLDAGCSDGFFDKMIKDKAGKIYGIDINESDIEIAKTCNPGNIYIAGDLTRLPYEANYFDTIVCIDVLEHVADDEKVISELSRVLHKEGKIIITVPHINFPFSYDPINYILKFFKKKLNIGMWGFGHTRLYSMAGLSGKLEKCGLKIESKEYISHFLVGFFESGYLANILQPFIKSDSKNKNSKSKDSKLLKKRLSYKIPGFLVFARDFILSLDKKIFRCSHKSINILIVARKKNSTAPELS